MVNTASGNHATLSRRDQLQTRRCQLSHLPGPLCYINPLCVGLSKQWGVVYITFFPLSTEYLRSRVVPWIWGPSDSYLNTPWTPDTTLDFYILISYCCTWNIMPFTWTAFRVCKKPDKILFFLFMYWQAPLHIAITHERLHFFVKTIPAHGLNNNNKNIL